MSDINIHNKFLQLFQGFIKDLIVTLPDYSEKLTNSYSDLLELSEIDDIQTSDQLNKISECIFKHNTNITNRDRNFFDSEPDLLEGISLKQLWNKDITPKNRNIIWKYLQSFCIISMNIKSSENLKKLLNGDTEEVNKNDLKSLKKLNKLTETIKNDIEPEKNGDFDLENLLESSTIGKLAKDIASNLDLGDMGSQVNKDDMDIGKIMQSTDFMGIFNKINEQVQEKFTSGDIDSNLLSNEAEQMLPNMLNNPFFKNMMNSDLFKNFEKK